MKVAFGLLFCFIAAVIFFYVHSSYLYNVYVFVDDRMPKQFFFKALISDCFEIHIFYTILISLDRIGSASCEKEQNHVCILFPMRVQIHQGAKCML